MIGDYLTTKGRSVEDDIKMLNDLKLHARGDTQQRREHRHAPASNG
jgi:biotin synthase-like enzyme